MQPNVDNSLNFNLCIVLTINWRKVVKHSSHSNTKGVSISEFKIYKIVGVNKGMEWSPMNMILSQEPKVMERYYQMASVS